MVRLPDPGQPWRRILPQIPSPASGRFYIVGGWVRDLFLLGPRALGSDIDLAIDGDFEPWARAVARTFGAELRIEHDFLTARITIPGENGTVLRIDMSRFRKEKYHHPGELPRVEAGTMEDDAKRRDFSMNAIFLEWSTNQQKVLRIIDPYEGRASLRKGIIHPIRDDTFREDPTRILRWARLSVRLGLKNSVSLSKSLEKAVQFPDLWDRVGGARVFREIERMMSEPDPLEVLERLFDHNIINSLGGMGSLSSARMFRLRRWISFRKTLALCPGYSGVESLDREMFFLALFFGIPRGQFRMLASSLGIGEKMRDRLEQVLFEKKGWAFPTFYVGFEKVTGRDPGQMKAVSDRLDLGKVLLLALIGQESDFDFWRDYVERDRWVPPLLGGEELLKYPTIPPIMRGQILAEVRRLQRTGVLKGPDEAKIWLAQKVSVEFP